MHPANLAFEVERRSNCGACSQKMSFSIGNHGGQPKECLLNPGSYRVQRDNTKNTKMKAKMKGRLRVLVYKIQNNDTNNLCPSASFPSRARHLFCVHTPDVALRTFDPRTVHWDRLEYRDRAGPGWNAHLPDLGIDGAPVAIHVLYRRRKRR